MRLIEIGLVVLIQLFIIAVLFFLTIGIYFSLYQVPYVKTSRKISKLMLKLGELKAGERVIDFGSGDGSLVIDAARDFKAFGVGIEGQWYLVQWARLRARLLKQGDRVKFVHDNFFKIKPPPADLIVCYLFPGVNLELEPILLRNYPSGTRVVSRVFKFPNFNLIKTIKAPNGDSLHYYHIP
ncbi:SAM-dependent methyltransferase [Patescibacteria group bacterium]